jgi:hypothetical protein
VHDAGGHVAELTFPDVRWADKRAAGTFLCGLLGYIKSYADLKGLKNACRSSTARAWPAYRESIEA